MLKTLLALALLAPPVPPPAPPTLEWGPCPGAGDAAAECADLAVPVAEPGGRTLTLKVARLPATGPRKGAVLVNFGGPQGGQIAIMRARPRLFDQIRGSMDVVTWDPRGYPGLSGPVLPCDWGLLRTPPFPADQAGFDRLDAANRARGDRCRATDPELFDHMDSGADARDAEAIRVAIGERRMTFIGTSYGGMIAQSYARQFPRRVRALYLDGTANHSTRDWGGELVAIAGDYQRFLDRFFAWAEPGTRQRWRALLDRADREPVPAPAVGAAYDGTHLRALAFAKVRGGPARWPDLAAALAAAERGDASAMAFSPREPYPALSGGGVKECLDFPRPRDQAQVARTVEHLRRVAPDIGAAFPLAWHAPLTCAGWPAPVANPPAPLPGGLPPLLGAGTWLDHDATERLVRQVPGSRMLTHDGPGHNLLLMGNPCVLTHASRYVTTGRLPSGDVACP